MTYDCFTFFNELDLLELRLNILDSSVDKFVIVEAPWTHTGNEKPLYFRENADRFAAFHDKIIHIVASTPSIPRDAPPRENAWRRENFQRNEIVRGLSDARPDDLVLLSDLDEIPSPEAIAKARGLNGVSRFRQRFYNFFLNYRNYALPYWPIGTQACTYETFLNPDTYAGQQCDQYLVEDVNRGPTMTRLRMAKVERIIKNGGWHFSYCGGVDAIRAKLAAFAHTESNTGTTADPQSIDAIIRRGRDPIRRGYRFFAEPLDGTFPQYLRENTLRYRSLILPADADYLRRTRISRALAIVKGVAYRTMVRCIPSWLVPFALKVKSRMYSRRVS